MSNEYKESGNVNENNKIGKVWLVGAGPNDPGLLTLKGKSVLEQADVVVYDHLVGSGILAMIPKTAKLINVGKVSGDHPVPQKEINQILVEEALNGKRVARLKGGDPFVFGRGGEELEELCSHGISFEIVPGVTSAISVPAYNGIPVTHRDFCSSLHIITGHTKNLERADIDFPALVKFGGTLVFLMGVASMPVICKELIDAGMDPAMPAAILENGTTAHQRRVVSDLTNLPAAAVEAEIKTPAIIVVGKVCGLAEQFHWAEDRPLGRMKILVTRPKERSSSLAEKLREFGAEVVEAPTIETDEILNNDTLNDALRNIKNYDWIAFTSPFGVKVFFQRLQELKLDIRMLAGLKFAAIGSATQKAIEEKGILVDLVPETYDGKALGETLANRLLTSEDAEERKPVVLIPRARIGSEEVLKPLEEAGIDFEDLPVYDTTEVEYSGLTWYDESVDYVAFTSASTVRGFVKLAGEIDLTQVKAVCIGEQTAQEAKKYGMTIHIANKATVDSMVDCFLALSEVRR
jgi:uroporphyrinogen III methyltransferase/synthase